MALLAQNGTTVTDTNTIDTTTTNAGMPDDHKAFEAERQALRERYEQGQMRRLEIQEKVDALNAKVQDGGPTNDDITELLGYLDQAEKLNAERESIEAAVTDLVERARESGYLEMLTENGAMPVAKLIFQNEAKTTVEFVVFPDRDDVGILVEGKDIKRATSYLTQEEAMSLGLQLLKAATMGQELAQEGKEKVRRRSGLAEDAPNDAVQEALNKSPLFPGLYSWDPGTKN